MNTEYKRIAVMINKVQKWKSKTKWNFFMALAIFTINWIILDKWEISNWRESFY